MSTDRQALRRGESEGSDGYIGSGGPARGASTGPSPPSYLPRGNNTRVDRLIPGYGDGSRAASDGEVRIEVGTTANEGGHDPRLLSSVLSRHAQISQENEKELSAGVHSHQINSQENLGDLQDKLWRSEDDYHYKINIPHTGNHWQECMKRVDKYDDDMCNGWKDEIDTLLVFAGLFSAAVTAFTIESYQWLQADPNDAVVRALSQISLQLDNSTGAGPAPTPGPFVPSRSSVRINIFWFLSLTLSLTSVLVGILCKQWIREYREDALMSYRDALALRQMRYEALLAWKVPGIVAFLPLLLQIALVFFFIGLVDLLWGLHRAVGAAVTVVVGAGILGLVATTVLPAFQWAFYPGPYERPLMCAYKSPQSGLFLRILTLLGKRRDQVLKWTTYEAQVFRFPSIVDKYLIRGMVWLDTTFTQSVDTMYHILQCVEDLEDDVDIENVLEHFRLRGEDDEPVYEHLAASSNLADIWIKKFHKDIFATLYLPRHQKNYGISERRLRVINTSTGLVPSAIFWDALEGLATPVPDGLRWQIINSLRCAIAQGRVKDDDVHSLAYFVGMNSPHLPEGDLVWLLEDLTRSLERNTHQSVVRSCIDDISRLAFFPTVHVATIAPFIRYLDQSLDAGDLHLGQAMLRRWNDVKDKYLSGVGV